jgi:hypothetical protein
VRCGTPPEPQVAVYLGFTIFIVGWIMQTVVLFGVPYSPQYFKSAGGCAALRARLSGR